MARKKEFTNKQKGWLNKKQMAEKKKERIVLPLIRADDCIKLYKIKGE